MESQILMLDGLPELAKHAGPGLISFTVHRHFDLLSAGAENRIPTIPTGFVRDDTASRDGIEASGHAEELLALLIGQLAQDVFDHGTIMWIVIEDSHVQELLRCDLLTGNESLPIRTRPNNTDHAVEEGIPENEALMHILQLPYAPLPQLPQIATTPLEMSEMSSFSLEVEVYSGG